MIYDKYDESQNSKDVGAGAVLGCF
ncbi:MAG: hypothetical protein ACLT9Z_01620 [Finegoldia magna]